MEQLSQFAEIGLFFYILCKNPFETSTNICLQLLRKLDLKKAPLVRSCETGASLQEAFTLTILQFTCKAWTKVVKDICRNDNITTNNRNFTFPDQVISWKAANRLSRPARHQDMADVGGAVTLAVVHLP